MELQTPAQIVTDKDGNYTVTLLRETTVVYYLNSFWHLLAVPESGASYYREKVLGPAYDGMIYMFYRFGLNPDYLWLSKEEYDILLPIWNDLHPSESCDDSEDLDEECDYCHGPIGRCHERCKDRDFY